MPRYIPIKRTINLPKHNTYGLCDHYTTKTTISHRHKYIAYQKNKPSAYSSVHFKNSYKAVMYINIKQLHNCYVYQHKASKLCYW